MDIHQQIWRNSNQSKKITDKLNDLFKEYKTLAVPKFKDRIAANLEFPPSLSLITGRNWNLLYCVAVLILKSFCQLTNEIKVGLDPNEWRICTRGMISFTFYSYTHNLSWFSQFYDHKCSLQIKLETTYECNYLFVV